MTALRWQGHATPWGPGFRALNARDAMWAKLPDPRTINPLLGCGFVEDFTRFSPDQYTVTAVEAGTGDSTIAQADVAGGGIRINCAANENDGAQAQSVGEWANLAASLGTSGEILAMDFLVNLTEEATQSDASVGLATRSTTIIASAPNDFVHFHKDDGDTNWDFSVSDGGSATDLAAIATATAGTQILLGFVYDLHGYQNATAGTIEVWIDGVKYGTVVSTNIPTATLMAHHFAYLNGAGTAQNDGMNILRARAVMLNSYES